MTASDTAGNTAEVSIAFPAVTKGDQTLTGFQYSASSVAFGSAAPTVTAPGGVETTLSYSATPSTVCTVNSSSGALTLAGVGDCVITATAAGTDDYDEITAMFTVTVQATGALVLNLDAVATDNTINIDEKTAGFTISGDTGSEAGVSITVTVGSTELTATSADDNGTATWSVSVPADANYITGTSLVVEVNATRTGFTAPAAITRTLTVDLTAPTAPTYTAPGSLKVGVAIAAMSPSGGIGTDAYSATGLPPGLSIDTGTGVISGTPDTAEANTASVTVTASDTAGNTAEVSIAFPAVTKGDQTLTGFQYSASSVAFGSTAPTVTAPGGVVTTLSYSATPSTVCTVNSSSGVLTLVGVGSCVVTATAASTANYNEATDTVTVIVEAAIAPDAPTGLTAQASETKAALSWTAPSNTGTSALTGFTLYRGDGNACDNLASLQTGIAADATYVEDTTVSAESTYCYAVTATSNAGESGRSNSAAVKATTPAAPRALTVTSTSDTAIALSWTAPVDDGGGALDGYNVYRCDPGDSCTPAYLDWAGDATAYTDTDVVADTTYRYAVGASRLDGLSDWSNELTAVAQVPTTPDAPTGLTAQASETKAALSWTAPSNTGTSALTGFTLYRGDGNACDNLASLQTEIAADATYVEDTTVSAESTYCYAVTATSNAGESDRSNSAAVKATTPAAAQGTDGHLHERYGHLAELDGTGG